MTDEQKVELQQMRARLAEEMMKVGGMSFLLISCTVPHELDAKRENMRQLAVSLSDCIEYIDRLLT